MSAVMVVEHGTAEDLVSTEVQEIISYRPHWTVRRGNMVFFAILLLLVGGSWFIHYPDRVAGSARLVALNAPKMLTARTGGKLEKLLVKNEQPVEKGAALAWLQSTASTAEVLKLKEWITEAEEQVRGGSLETLLSKPLPALGELGELQAAFGEFQNIASETTQLLARGYFTQKRRALQKDLVYLASLKSHTLSQRALAKQDQSLQAKEYEAYEALARDKVIAPLELNQYRSRLLAKEGVVQGADAQLTNSDIASHNKRKELAELEKFDRDQRQRFYASMFTLKSAVESWMQKYVIEAPEEGTVYFVNSLQENGSLEGGAELFYIQAQTSGYYAEMMIGQTGIGKVAKGQSVQLKAAGYPVEEFGFLKATISSIAGLPNRRDSFLVTLHLSDGLKTNVGKELFFRNGLLAEGTVITADRRLLQRLMGQLKRVWEY